MEPEEEIRPKDDSVLVINEDFMQRHVYGKNGQEVANELMKNEVWDITEGYPAESADQLSAILRFFAENDIHRQPIVGFKSEPGGRIYILCSPHQVTHRDLLELLQKEPKEALFASAFEGLAWRNRGFWYTPHWLLTGEKEKGDRFYVRVGVTSDAVPKGLTKEGVFALRKIFEQIPGIKFQRG